METPTHYSSSCPTSLQLRWAINGRMSCWLGRSKVLIVTPSCTRRDGVRIVSCPSGSAKAIRSMTAHPHSEDGFAGWCDTGCEDWEADTVGMIGFGGVGRAGLAGISVLLAGLALSGLLLSNRRWRKPTPIIEPINAEQVTPLYSDGEDTVSFEPETSLTTDNSSPRDSNHIALHGSMLCESDESPGRDSSNFNETSIQDDSFRESNLDDRMDVSASTPAPSNSNYSFSGANLFPNPNGETTEHQEDSCLSDAVDVIPTANIVSEDEVACSLHTITPAISEMVNAPTYPLDHENLSEDSILDLDATLVGSQGDGDDGNDFRLTEKPSHFSNQDMEVESEFDTSLEKSFSSSEFPTQTVGSPLHALHTKVLVPALMDLVQGQTLAALQSLKVVEMDALPTDLCTRREYARWLVTASCTLSRNMQSKVYPAMFIENITELAFDDISLDDPDYSSIQGLAEAGFIPSKLSKRDLTSSDENQSPALFHPDSPLLRQDLVCWKMALERRQLPESDKKMLYELSGFRDVDRIHSDAWPALIADLSSGNQGIISLAFGFTRLFQPDKPVTKAQAAVAIGVGESADVVNEELTRIAAESAAENAVMAHNDLVTQVEREINASFEKELLMEKERTIIVENKFEEALRELDKLRAEREMNNVTLMKERVAIESELEILSRQRREYQEQLENLLSNKLEVSFEKERINKLQKDAEIEKQEISRLQFELEVEKRALSMAREWAEDEARNAREQANALEKARIRWEQHGIKVVVDDDLRQESLVAVTERNTEDKFRIAETVDRAATLTDNLKAMADRVRSKSKELIDSIIQKVVSIVEWLKNMVSRARTDAYKLKESAIERTNELRTEFQGSAARINSVARERVSEFRENAEHLSFVLKESARRAVESSRDGVSKLTQKFKF